MSDVWGAVSVAVSVSSTVAVAIAGGLIKYAFNINERLTRLEECMKAIKRDIEEIKDRMNGYDEDIRSLLDRMTRAETKLSQMSMSG